jgi:hypothetical protein
VVDVGNNGDVAQIHGVAPDFLKQATGRLAAPLAHAAMLWQFFSHSVPGRKTAGKPPEKP